MMIEENISFLEQFIKNYPLFCFDFDGLLVDTETIHYEAYKKTSEKYGGTLPLSFNEYAYLAHHHDRKKLAEFAYKYAPNLPSEWEDVRSEKATIYTKLLKEVDIRILPGVCEVLKHLADSPVTSCVVTNSLAEDIEILKSRLSELSLIPHWFTRETYEKPKPSPDGYNQALSTLKFQPDQAIGFEDTQKGIKALEAAHIKPILVCHDSHPQIKELSDIQFFPSFFEMLQSN